MIDFWFSLGSTYSFLSAMRLPDVARAEGVTFNWRPFSVRRIMREMDNRFLAGKPEKYSYMWRDISRRAEMLGVPANVPLPHPIAAFDTANRVALIGMQEGWGVEYTRAAFRAWFEFRQEPGSEPNLSNSIRAAGQDPARVIALAEDAATDQAYQAATDEAKALGIFGAPTFVVNKAELFWGDDKLEQAINWLRLGRVAP